jgi:hypothetical protein
MAMTKKEKVEMERLKDKIATHFYPIIYPEVDPDIDPPDSFNKIVNGWTYNEYAKEVRKACTTSISHNNGGWDKTSSQGSMKLYSTKKRAYAALLNKMVDMYARELRSVEEKMEYECSPDREKKGLYT